MARGKHVNAHLQSAWDKHGASVFEFEILEVTSPDARLAREDYWLNYFNACDSNYGFNLEPSATSPTHGDETRAKISASLKSTHNRALNAERMKQRMNDPEYAAKVAASRGTPERRAKMSAIMKERMSDPEYYDKMMSIVKSPENIAKRAESGRKRMGNPEERARIASIMSKSWIVTDPEGNVYHVRNLSAFCREHGLSMANMSQTAHGKQSHHKGWKCAHDRNG